jgi:hypothetical protein
MTHTAEMMLSSEQAHRVDEAEADGHEVVQLGRESFACIACELDGRVTDTCTEGPLSIPCQGLWFEGDGPAALTP